MQEKRIYRVENFGMIRKLAQKASYRITCDQVSWSPSSLFVLGKKRLLAG